MSLDISSLTGGERNSLTNLSPTSGREKNRSQLIDNPVQRLLTNTEKTDSIEAKVLEPISLSTNHRVDYKIDPKTQEIIIHIIDRESGELVQQIPGEGFLKLSQKISDFNRTIIDTST
ncbi:MAG: hypothetical protein HOL15_00040 [Nitrospinaceae bacterium]|jgi:uncharacterized FlaG/YvyC family protein|nr:hypothetical protein [Nitrospina sp.]MBT5375182.1 hypothetical protein [Nitrospinaceae bacterium]MBT5869877.1 hypothetical protein [Nitrospinaceae bacterium]MBT6347014.1 hypothetical protein [Nitrospina sp.]